MVKKQIFLFLMLGLFLISFANAAEFDNIGQYNKETKTMTIKNSILGIPFFDLGTVAEVRLDTPLDYHVAPGYQKVAQFTITQYEDYSNVLKELELFDKKGGMDKFTRDFDYKYLTYENLIIDEYESVIIGKTKNGTDIYDMIISGNHTEKTEKWVKLGPSDFKKNDIITIGIFTNVEKGDIIEWIPNIMGVRIDVWAVWTADLNVGIVSYYKLDESSGIVIDSLGTNNGTNNGATPNVPGKINTAYDLDGVGSGNNHIDLGDDLIPATANFTINLWAKTSDTSIEQRVFQQYTSGTDGRMTVSIYNGGTSQFQFNGGVTLAGTDLTDNDWHMITVRRATNNFTLWEDGVQVDTGDSVQNIQIGTNSFIGVNDFHINTSADEVSVWNRSLLDSEIVQLDNEGMGMTYTTNFDLRNITIDLNSPENNIVTVNKEVLFNVSINATELLIINVSLLIDGEINETNSSGIVGDYIFEKNLSFEDHNWSIRVVDNNTNITNSVTRNLSIIDGSLSGVWTDEYQVRIIAGSLTEADFEINNVIITQESDNLWKVNTTESNYEVARAQVMKTFFYGTDGSDPRINRTIGLLKIQTIDIGDVNRRGIYVHATETTGISYSYIGTFLNTSLNNGCSSWSYLSHTGTDGFVSSWAIPDGTIRNTISGGPVVSDEIGVDTSLDETNNPTDSDLNLQGRPGFGSTSTGRVILFCVGGVSWVDGGLTTASNIDFTVNKSIPITSPIPNITLNSPIDELDVLLGENIEFNASATITGSTLNHSILYINGEINETRLISGTENTSIFTKSFSTLGSYNWTIEVCDVNDNCALSDTRDFTIFPFTIDGYSYDSNITEGETNTISIQVVVDEGSSLSDATLKYDGTNYTTSLLFSNNTYIVTSTITTPLVSADINKSFNFYLTVDSITYQLQSLDQLILNLDFDICGGESNDTLLNMSLFDEETKINITGTMEFNSEIISKSSGEAVAIINGSFEDVHNGAICFSPVSSYSLYYLNTEIRYFKEGFATEFYHIQKADMSEYPVNLSLFNLNQNDSTEFSVTYKNNAFIFTEGAVIQLQRKYIGEDTYEVVEAPITGDGGKATLHIDLNTNKYRASVVKEGELLDFFDNIVFSCDNELSGDCTHSLDGTVNPNNDIPIEDITDFIYSVSVDEDNQTITVLFAVPSGTPSRINILLKQIDTFGNLTSCNTTIITSAGSITCDYTDSIEQNILQLSISKNDVQLAILSYVNNPSLDMDGINFFIMFLFMISLVGMAIASPEWMLIISVMVLMIGGTLLLVSGMNLVIGLGALAWLVVAIGIIIFKMAKQEDR